MYSIFYGKNADILVIIAGDTDCRRKGKCEGEVKVKVQVNFTLEQATLAHNGSECIALFFL